MNDDLITAGELASVLDGSPQPVLVDVRWKLGSGADRAGYLQGRIPGAAFVDLDAELARRPEAGGRHPLPEPVALQGTWRRVGIDDDSSVVVYDDADGSAAVRAWWLLRWSGLTDVRVLQGGLGSWTGALESGEPAPRVAGAMTVRPGGMPTIDIDAAADLAARPDATLLDARAAERFRGEIEPLDPVAGHIPGAVNLPYSSLYEHGHLLPTEELRTAFRRAGVIPGRLTGASCGSGVTACHLVWAGRMAGLDLALYPGSYSEWLARGRPAETG